MLNSVSALQDLEAVRKDAKRAPTHDALELLRREKSDLVIERASHLKRLAQLASVRFLFPFTYISPGLTCLTTERRGGRKGDGGTASVAGFDPKAA